MTDEHEKNQTKLCTKEKNSWKIYKNMYTHKKKNVMI
jgi:hypothetical protein